MKNYISEMVRTYNKYVERFDFSKYFQFSDYQDISHGMASPKSKRSKQKGRTRLAMWKKKAAESGKKAINQAKRLLGKETEEERKKKETEIKQQNQGSDIFFESTNSSNDEKNN